MDGLPCQVLHGLISSLSLPLGAHELDSVDYYHNVNRVEVSNIPYLLFLLLYNTPRQESYCSHIGILTGTFSYVLPV